MARYIHAERLKDSMFAYYDCLSESAKGRPYKGDTLMDYEVVDMIEDCIENAPTADVEEVKHGEYIYSSTDNKWHCSECFAERPRNNGDIPYSDIYCCYKCGAKMDGERK